MAAKSSPEDPAAAFAEAPGENLPSYLDGVRAEYSQYVALQTLSYQGVPCYGQGASVAASHPNLEQWIAAGVVAPVS